MISVVSLHWKRTENTHTLLKSLQECRLVDDVIVWNNNPEVRFQAEPWVRVINTSEDFGLCTRMGAALYANNECVLTIDDDNVVPQHTIYALFEAFQREPEIIHSLDGRGPTASNEYAKKIVPAADESIAEAPISLTRCAMFKQEYAALYFLMRGKIQKDLEHPTRGNGEDILLSYIARQAANGRLHKIHSLPRSELPAPHAIHRRPGHREFRTRLMRRCQERFGF